MEKSKLAQARARKNWTLKQAADAVGVSAITFSRWESGGQRPYGYNLDRLSEVFDASPEELGFDTACVETEVPEQHPLVAALLGDDLTMRLQAVAFVPQRFEAVLAQIVAILEEYDAMNEDAMTRREALIRLASLPFIASLRPGLLTRRPEDVITQCSAGIAACWKLRKGEDLIQAFSAAAGYTEPLKEIVKVGTDTQRKSAADLLAQCLLLKATLSWHISTPIEAIGYAQEAETYSNIAEKPLLQIASLRVQAAAFRQANQVDQALQTGLKAKRLLETTPKELIPQLARSYVYAGLATYQGYHAQKQDALTSLKKAHATFFQQPPDETIPIWIDHHIGNLLINDGLTHAHLDLHQGAVDSYAQIKNYAEDTTISLTCRIEAWIGQATAEANCDDQPRDMEKCIVLWKQGMESAKMVQSNKYFNNAIVAYATMRGAWPGEQRIKELKELIVHW